MADLTERCEICGEPLDGRGNGTAEMCEPHDPAKGYAASVICHADCGLARGLEIA